MKYYYQICVFPELEGVPDKLKILQILDKTCQTLSKTEVIFLVMCDPSMNEL